MKYATIKEQYSRSRPRCIKWFQSCSSTRVALRPEARDIFFLTGWYLGRAQLSPSIVAQLIQWRCMRARTVFFLSAENTYCGPPFFNSTPLGRNKYKLPNISFSAETESLMMLKHSRPRQFNNNFSVGNFCGREPLLIIFQHISLGRQARIYIISLFSAEEDAVKMANRDSRPQKLPTLRLVALSRPRILFEHHKRFSLGRTSNIRMLVLFRPRSVLLKNGGQQYVFLGEKKHSILALQCHWMICGRGNHRNLYYPFFSTYSSAEVILILYILPRRPFSNFISEHDPPSITIAFLADEIIMWSSSEKISPAFHDNALCVSAAATSFLDPPCFGWVPYFIVAVYCGRPFRSLLIDLFFGRKSYFSRWFWSYIDGSV